MNNVPQNMKVYDALRECPEEAQKPITSGPLKGYTNIIPQWRYERLTREFGVCGIGWRYDRPEYSFEKLDNGVIVCFCSTNLYVRIDGEWSEPIPGEGGSNFVSSMGCNELIVSDECRKMALTDALGTAAKMLGLAADVYFAQGARDSKYPSDDTQDEPERPQPIPAAEERLCCADCGAPITERERDFSVNVYGRPLCRTCQNAEKKSGQESAPMQTMAAPVTDDDIFAADPLCAAMTRDEAAAYVVPKGLRGAGMTLQELMVKSPETVKYCALDANGRVARLDPGFHEACRIMLGMD